LLEALAATEFVLEQVAELCAHQPLGRDLKEIGDRDRLTQRRR